MFREGAKLFKIKVLKISLQTLLPEIFTKPMGVHPPLFPGSARCTYLL